MAVPLAQFTRFYVHCPIPNEVFCNVCNPQKRFLRHGDLNKHLKKYHQSVIAWQCVTCNEQFDDIRSCKAHQRRSNHVPVDNSDDVVDVDNAADVEPSDPPVIIQPSAPISDTQNNVSLPLPPTVPAQTVIPDTNEQTSRARPNNTQKMWILKIINCNSIEEVDSTFSDWAKIISPPMQQQPLTNNRPPRVRIPMSAARLQKLYRTNRPKAMNYVNSISQKQCQIPINSLQSHFIASLQAKECMIGDRPTQIPVFASNTQDPLGIPYHLR